MKGRSRGCSSAAASRNQLEQVVELRLAVLRPGQPSGWNWTEKARQLAVAQPLDRAVVEAQVADVEAAGVEGRAGLDLELVVLAGDGDPAGWTSLARWLPPWWPNGRRVVLLPPPGR